MKYPGGKGGAGVYQRIINRMPPHEVYIEPFFGGGAIMLHKRPARLNIALDLVAPSELASVPEVRERFARSPTANPGERRRKIQPATALPDPEFQFIQGDGIGFLETHTFTGAELVYCDPPYLMETRSGGPLYEHEMSDVDHRRLLRCILDLPCLVMLSGYQNPMYSQALKGWNSIHYPVMTRGGSLKTEWLWYNFRDPVFLHDYQYLGEDYQQRWNLTKQKRRWRAKLEKMPLQQRQALMQAIADTFGNGDASRITAPERLSGPSLFPRRRAPKA